MPIGFPISISLKTSITHSMDASCGFWTEMAASSGYGTNRTTSNVRCLVANEGKADRAFARADF
jgi:hypothetical protein